MGLLVTQAGMGGIWMYKGVCCLVGGEVMESTLNHNNVGGSN